MAAGVISARVCANFAVQVKIQKHKFLTPPRQFAPLIFYVIMGIHHKRIASLSLFAILISKRFLNIPSGQLRKRCRYSKLTTDRLSAWESPMDTPDYNATERCLCSSRRRLYVIAKQCKLIGLCTIT